MSSFFLSILFGVLAMFSWGIGDLLGAISSRKIGPLKSFFWMRLLGFILALWYLLLTKEKIFFNLIFLGPLLVAGFLEFLGTISFYKGFVVGNISLVSPVASSWAIITTTLSLIFLKENLFFYQIIALLFIFFGIWFITINFESLKQNKKLDFFKGGKEGLTAMFCWGIMAFLLVLITKKFLSWYMPLLVMRVVTILTIILYSLFTKSSLGLTKNKISLMKLLLAVAIFDQIAGFSSNLGVLNGQASIVSPISSAFGAVTAILAIIFFKEKLIPTQVFGIISIVVGVVILSF